MRRAICALVAVLATTLAANAGPLFTIGNNSSGTFLGNPPFTLGFEFTVGTNGTQRMTKIGVFDSDQNGLAVAHRVGLWNSSGVLLASGIVPAGTAGSLVNQFRYIDINPVILGAGTYRIGALYDGPVFSDSLIFPGQATGFATDPNITFVGSRFAFGAGLTDPTGNGGLAPGYFGPNALIEATPEPFSMVVFGGLLAAGGLAVRRRMKVAA